MDQKKAKAYREKLQLKKQQILEAYNKNKSYGKEADGEATQDIADKAANSYTKEFLFSLSNTERDTAAAGGRGARAHRHPPLRRVRRLRGRHERRSGSRRSPGRGCASRARRSRNRGSSSIAMDLSLASSVARRLAGPVLAVVFPSECPACGQLHRPARPRAAVRAVLALAAAARRDRRAAAACRSRRAFRRARAAGAASQVFAAGCSLGPYEGTLRVAIHELKFSGRRRAAARLAELLLADPATLQARRDQRRARRRCRCTRAACASAASTRRRCSPRSSRAARRSACCPDALVRRLDTAPQAGLSAAARRRNVREAFAVRRKATGGGQDGDAGGRRGHDGRHGARLRPGARRGGGPRGAPAEHGTGRLNESPFLARGTR